MTIVLLILNCKKYDKKRQRQLSDWLRPFPIPYYHVIADQTLTTDYTLNSEEHLLTVNTADDYMNLPKKVYLAIKAISEEIPDIKYILKTDDDMNCNLSQVKPILDFIQKQESDYGGHIVNCNNDYLSTYHYIQKDVDKKPALCRKCMYSCGRFYYLSKKAIDAVMSNKSIFWDSAYEDNTVGFVLTNTPGIRMDKIPDKLLFYEYT